MITIDGQIRVDKSVWMDVELYIFGIEVEACNNDNTNEYRIARIDARAKLLLSRKEEKGGRGRGRKERGKALKSMSDAFPHLRRLQLRLVRSFSILPLSFLGAYDGCDALRRQI